MKVINLTLKSIKENAVVMNRFRAFNKKEYENCETYTKKRAINLTFSLEEVRKY